MLIDTPDGRQLEVLDGGGDGLPCVFHTGTPGGPVLTEKRLAAAADAGLRWIGYARPGYGQSTPMPGRSVADAAQDTATVLDALGLSTFVTAGASGGGPHALACAALLPGRCLAAATLAGGGPFDAEGLDFLAGMGEDNLVEFGLAVGGREVLEAAMPAYAQEVRGVTPEGIVASLSSLLPPVDREVLSSDVGRDVAAGFHKALEVGYDGWLDDDLALVKPWGFDLSTIRVPVVVWQGGQDLMVPLAHGQWLAANVPGARAELHDEHGHLSLVVAHLPAVLKELADLAR
ncbi:MAG: alpha/beta hydrolase fold protein [Frankiales bacterium]|nr:alpha/beta hydrolase fold protein [Frankiales bacterium]